jgi:hypothetical protein
LISLTHKMCHHITAVSKRRAPISRRPLAVKWEVLSNVVFGEFQAAPLSCMIPSSYL